MQIIPIDRKNLRIGKGLGNRLDVNDEVVTSQGRVATILAITQANHLNQFRIEFQDDLKPRIKVVGKTRLISKIIRRENE